jgi:hypothetical protein
MAESPFPTTIAGFTEYIKTAYHKAQPNLTTYGVAEVIVINPKIIIL